MDVNLKAVLFVSQVLKRAQFFDTMHILSKSEGQSYCHIVLRQCSWTLVCLCCSI